MRDVCGPDGCRGPIGITFFGVLLTTLSTECILLASKPLYVRKSAIAIALGQGEFYLH